MATYLKPAPLSDQRFPCSFANTDALDCTTRASFRILPTATHSRDEWPTVQSCAAHLPRAVRLAEARCRNHCRGVRVSIL